MVDRQGRILRWLGKTFFGAVKFDESGVQTLREVGERGTPVYVLSVHSLLDYMYFNYAFLRFGLPLVFFANEMNMFLFQPVLGVFSYLWRRLFSCRGRGPDDRSMMRHGLSRGYPILLSLKRARALIQWGEEFRVTTLRDLIEIQGDIERPVVLVPLLLVWAQKPESYRRTIFDVVFGDPQAPGRFRKGLSFVFNFRKARVQVGRPIELKPFLKANADAADSSAQAARLKFALSNEFLLEQKAIRGPVLKGGRRIIDEIARTPPFIEEIERVAAESGLSPAAAMERARTMLKRMAADFRFRWLEGFAIILGLLFQRLFTGLKVNTTGLDAIRAAARTGPIVLAPAHRSHLDYLVFSLAFYTHGLIPPHIAAGENLSFWPMGPIFRRSGAFFIRRAIRGDSLYAAVLRQYVRKLLKDGYWVEFFIEGTRSRSGKALSPRQGMLSMVMDAVASGAASNAHVVPASVTYERVVEDRSYRRESQGHEKAPEGVGALARSAKLLVSRFGRLYLEFESPISLVDYLREEGVEIPLPPGQHVPAEVVRRFSFRLMNRIIRTFVVTPHHLVAFTLLTHTKRGILHSAFMQRIENLVVALHERGALLSDRALAIPGSPDPEPEPADPTRTGQIGRVPSDEVDDVLRLFRKDGMIEVTALEDDFVLSLTEAGRFGLDYYKNGIVHFFVPEAMMAVALLHAGGAEEPTLDALRERCLALSRTFRFEFVYPDGRSFDQMFQTTLDGFVRDDLVRIEDGRVSRLADGAETLVWLAGILRPFVEAYRVFCRTVVETGGNLSDKDLVKAALRNGRKWYSTGDVELPESISMVLMKAALVLLRSEVRTRRSGRLVEAAETVLEVLGHPDHAAFHTGRISSDSPTMRAL
jgi:glycerol-3-phosphate O-acyltransferase